jgi:short-subunit dehydrogenase
MKLTLIALRELAGRNKKEVVLVLGSMTAFLPQYTSPLYSASKHTLVGFVRSLGPAEEYEGVKVVTICPGYGTIDLDVLVRNWN